MLRQLRIGAEASQECRRTCEVQDNSTSIFLAARSSFTMRKLRTCPARAGSALTGAPAPVFQRAWSMELNEERSAAAGAAASLFPGAADPAVQAAGIPAPSPTHVPRGS